ncbi:hypothetical protein O181_071586 [Austropuccinia psidii MF-1]|uniref:Reverse transcriptase/retrotransposon-derived protein RNase H-like domain-containing protein n=1 Tax=Austropuccinia psidii MF-1 TaxID=1389203 RepID=A0A9Q3F106_9BASI|nr:hypothetical protein [Austropuccinia psidii MF-1]
MNSLTSLFKKDYPFIFNEEALNHFQILKEAFTTAPVLSHFNPSLPTIVETDASDYYLSSVLSWVNDSGKNPIAFEIFKLLPADLNYEIHEMNTLQYYGTITSLDLTQIFISHVFSKHGLPASIQLKISRDPSASFPPETDQQTERLNKILEQYLCMYSLDLVGHVTSASRQHQSSHVSHENVTQSPNPFQHYSQCLGNFTSLASTSTPNPPQHFACLRTHIALHMRLRHCPPISVSTTPDAFTPPPLPSLFSRGGLPTCS